MTAPGPDTVRLVTHLDVGREACRRAVEVLAAARTEIVTRARITAPAGHL